MAAMDETLSRAVKQLLQKFVECQQNLGGTQKNMQVLQAKNERLEADIETFKKERQKEVDMKESLEKLVTELKKKKDETFEDVKRREAAEAEARTNLTQRFQVTIAEITEKMEGDSEEQLAAVNENKRLKNKLAAIGEQVGLKAQQYEQLIKTREVELRLSEAKTEHLREMAKGDRCRVELQQKQLEEERRTEQQLKEQLSQLTTKFDELQTTITKSNKLFKEYKAEMDKMTKKIKALESEKADILKRYAVKKRPNDTVTEEVATQQKKLEQLKKAGQSMLGLVEVLKKESDDVEAWKVSNPEAYATAAKNMSNK